MFPALHPRTVAINGEGITMKKKEHLLALAITALIVNGCASNSKEIQAAYVSPMMYQDFSCSQLVAESQRIQRRVSGAAGAVDERASGDKMKMGVGLVLFWPTLFFLKGDGAEHQELARLKGEFEAIELAYTRRDCANQPDEPSVIDVATDATATIAAQDATGQSVSIRLESNGSEQIGQACKVKSGARVWDVQSGGLFVIPATVSGPLTVTCTLTDGDRVEAAVVPSVDNVYPSIIAIQI